MKKILLSIIMTWLCCAVFAQRFYGDVIKSENFDNPSFFSDFWTTVNATPGDEVTLQFTNPSSGSFTDIDASNVTSGYVKLKDGDKPMITITSNDINLAGKSGIAIGFYGKSMFSLTSWNNIYFKFEVSKDAGVNWTCLFNSESDSRDGIDLGSSWYLYKYFLSADYDGQTVKTRFVVDGASFSGWNNEIYFDNFFVSERYTVDPIIKGINYGIDERVATTGAFLVNEPVTVDFANGGKSPISSITMKYKINDGEVVSEVYTPSTPILTNGTGQYTFNKKADLSELRQKYKIEAWVEMTGDGDLSNNYIKSYAENITTGLPYTPIFLWQDGIAWYLGPDEWVKVNNGDGGNWTLTDEFGIPYWYIRNQGANADAYLITRPIYFDAGRTYEIKFDAFTNSSATETEKLNNLKVYASDNATLTGLTEIYAKTGINKNNALNQFTRYTATKTGPQYFVFYCNSPMTADEFRLQQMYIVESKAIDAGISSLVSPVIGKYEYSNAETVAVNVRNFGTTAITANAVTVKMQLLDGDVITETVSQAVAVGAEVEHTFMTKINPSDQSIDQILKVWTVLDGDQNTDNDSKEYILESLVTAIPYLPTTNQELSTMWTIEDKNTDKQAFVVVNDFTLGKPAFRYGGYSGYPQTIIMNSNDAFNSRPIRLIAGNNYKVSFQTRVEREQMPLRIDLYKIEGETKTLVKNISDLSIANTVFETKECTFAIEADGIYQVAFTVETSTSINFRIFCGDFKFVKLFDKDLSIRTMLLPSNQISCYNSFPIGATIRNEGLQTISTFKLKAVSPTIGTKEKSFTLSIAPGETLSCYFDENATFNGTESEELVMSVILDEDQDITNNSMTSVIEYVESVQTPYTCILNTAVDYLTVNNNKDNYIFKKFTAGSGMSSIKGVEYIGTADVDADDEVITKCITLESGKVYSIDFNHAVATADDIASLEVSVYNVASSSKIDVAYLHSIKNTTRTNFLGYFTVPNNGDYVIRLKACDKTTSLRLINNLIINSKDVNPDVEIIAITVPEADGIFTANETVAVSFKNASSLALSSIPFTLDVNGVKYYATYLNSLSEDDEATVDFTNVDLYTPGDYTLTATAHVTADATSANNAISKVIKSLPIIDVIMVSVDKPKSGSLSAEQEVMITVKNNGKGILTDIPVSCTVTSAAKTVVTGNISGPLNDGETIQFTFPQTFDMYEEMTYNIVVTSTIAGDINVEDNTITTSVVCSQEPFDAGVTAITSPVDGLLTATETVKITVKNYCTVDLFDVPVKVTVGTKTITGSVAKIAVGQEVEYTFAQTIDLAAYGLYTVTAATTLESDVNTENDEFSKQVKSYKIDVGVIEILSPNSGDNMGVEQVKVVVKNFGDVAVNNIPVRYKVTTMAQLGNITAEIAPGATLEFTFVSTYDFSDYKTYTITAYTEYTADMDNTNNQAVKEVTNTKKTIDIALTSLVSPTSGSDLTTEENVTVTVKNVGEAPVKDIPIECNVDGVVAKEVITETLATGAEISYTFTKKYDLSNNGRYNVKVTVKAVGDTNKTNDVVEAVIENNVGVSSLDTQLEISLYPNPVKDMLNVEGEYASMEIYNTSGKLIMTANGENRIDVTNLSTGVYIIKAYNNSKVGTYKIVK